VLVRPDVPIAAIDSAMFDAPVWSGEPLVGSAHTRHSAGRWGYVVACNVGAAQQPCGGSISLTSVGDDLPETARVAVYDWRRRRIDVLAAEGGYAVALEPAGWDYRVLAPVLPSGIAVIGDPELYACTGDARVADVAADGDGVVVSVLGANERVRIVGWSQDPISARAWSPAAGASEVASNYDATGRLWDAAIDVGAAGWAKLHIRPRL
jgi:hypothetical protein